MEQRQPKHAVIMCHPAEDSFNMSVADRYVETVRAAGHEALVRDLYRMNFDPVLRMNERPTSRPHILPRDVSEELELLSGTDVFVLVYPLWFGAPPAMLKGYIDRVLGAGFPYGAVRDGHTHPLMSGKRLVSFSSSGTTLAWLNEQGAWQSLRTLFDSYLCHAFSMQEPVHVHFDAIAPSSKPDFIHAKLFRVEEAAREICGELAFRDRWIRNS